MLCRHKAFICSLAAGISDTRDEYHGPSCWPGPCARAAQMIGECEHDPGPPLNGQACSHRANSEGRDGLGWTPTPPQETLDGQASSQSIKTQGDGFTHLHHSVSWSADLKPNNTDTWWKSRLTLPPWSLSSSNRDWNPQNSPVVSLIGGQTRSGLWLILNLNEFTQSCCDIPTEEVKHTCNSLLFIPWLHQRRPGTSAQWTRRGIKENTRDVFNNLFAYDYRKNTERERLIFVLVFSHFLFTI